MNNIRTKGLIVFLLCLPVLHFLTQKWVPYYKGYESIRRDTYFDWEKQLLFLLISLVVMLFLTIAIGSLLATLLGRHHYNLEFSALIGCSVGLFGGVVIMLLLVMFRNDAGGLQSMVLSIFSGYTLGIFIGIKNEIEDDERVC